MPRVAMKTQKLITRHVQGSGWVDRVRRTHLPLGHGDVDLEIGCSARPPTAPRPSPLIPCILNLVWSAQV